MAKWVKRLVVSAMVCNAGLTDLC